MVVVTPELEEISQALLQGKVITSYSVGPTHGVFRIVSLSLLFIEPL